MFLPDYLGIGAQRAATTWVHHCLREHPQIFVPPGKEIHFFDKHYGRGLTWYASHFRPGPGHIALGEVTPNYLDHKLAAPRMARVLPHARLFVILRDPVERALSAYRFFRRQFRGRTFAEACRSSYLIDLGCYARHLKRLFEYYPKEQVKIIFYEDVLRKPSTVLAGLFRFLGVADSFVPPSLRLTYNHGSLRTADETSHDLYRSNESKNGCVRRWLRKWLGPRFRSSRREMIAKPIVQELREVFREDVLELQELIGRDCSAWLASSYTELVDSHAYCAVD
jgi:hypothetical protein